MFHDRVKNLKFQVPFEYHLSSAKNCPNRVLNQIEKKAFFLITENLSPKWERISLDWYCVSRISLMPGSGCYTFCLSRISSKILVTTKIFKAFLITKQMFLPWILNINTYLLLTSGKNRKLRKNFLMLSRYFEKNMLVSSILS